MKAADEKDSRLMMFVIQSMPSVDDMVRLGADGTNALRAELTALHLLMYPLLQWILSSNRAHLQHIEKKNEIPGVGNCVAQFHLLSSNPQKESRFRQHRAAARTTKGGAGSFSAWHGSGGGNWHAILRTGLKNMSNTKLMSAGAVHGAGIYTAKNFHVSKGYMRQPSAAWQGAKYIPHRVGLLMMALCEVADVTPSTNGTTLTDIGNGMTTVQNEDLINTRFLFIFADTCDVGAVDATELKIPDAIAQMHS
jgi:hypothetical protein